MKRDAEQTPERVKKLERAVKAAIGLRKAIHDDGPVFKYLCVDRETVARFDALMESLK